MIDKLLRKSGQLLFLLLISTPIIASAVPFSYGDVFAAISNGKVQHYDSDLNLLETLDTGYGSFVCTQAWHLIQAEIFM